MAYGRTTEETLSNLLNQGSFSSISLEQRNALEILAYLGDRKCSTFHDIMNDLNFANRNSLVRLLNKMVDGSLVKKVRRPNIVQSEKARVIYDYHLEEKARTLVEPAKTAIARYNSCNSVY